MNSGSFGDSETYLALLLGDASFPGGALANSQGLESAVLHEVVNKNDIRTLQKYIDISIEQVAFQALPFVRTSHSMGVSFKSQKSVDIFQEEKLAYQRLDQYCHAFLSNDVSRRASINQGNTCSAFRHIILK